MQHLNHPIMEDLLEDKQYQRKLAEHERLEEEIALAQKGALVDVDQVKQLKARKLRVADEMEALRRTLH
ncbi:MAG: DUF465 domain-containing protein [Proteobacteria bacterium]|nr:DUF465 domain-containing protein [Pseudomonadota bacterium]